MSCKQVTAILQTTVNLTAYVNLYMTLQENVPVLKYLCATLRQSHPCEPLYDPTKNLPVLKYPCAILGQSHPCEPLYDPTKHVPVLKYPCAFLGQAHPYDPENSLQ